MRRHITLVVLVLTGGALLAALPALAASARTRTPAFPSHRLSVSAGHSLDVPLATHAVWPDRERCDLTAASPGVATRHKTLTSVEANLVLTFLAPRNVRAGDWHLSARCRFPGQSWSRTATQTVHVANRRSGSKALTGPLLTALSPGGPAIAGFGGVGVPPDPFENGECTYFAYEKRPDIYLQSVNAGAPAGGWDAAVWASRAKQYGRFQEGTTPAVGAIMVEPGRPGNKEGHVAYVTQVIDASHWVTQEMKTDGNVTANKVFTVYDDSLPNPSPVADPSGDYVSGGQQHRHVLPGTVFIYGGPVVNPPQYADELDHIVQWNGDTKAQKTAWLVVDEGGQLHRHWIPTIAMYWCLKNSGVPGPDVLPASELDALTDDTGVQATCTGNPNPPGSPQNGTGNGGAPPPTTYTELEGHLGTNTFTDPANASGEGARISAGETVQVACKVYDPEIHSVNPDGYWYQLASAPWNGAYYAPANTFMNGDPWNGPYTHNTDFNVPDCSGSSTPTTTTTTTTTPPPPQTWAETTGGVSHTWTNYTNAGGTEGPSIASNQAVQITCAVQGFKVADGNPWWYRIASAPWSNVYYVSADAFYNNGQTSGSLVGTPWVDPAVAQC